MINRRTAGHNFERKLAEELRELGFHRCQTSRYASREKDDQGVDFVNTEPFSIQAKRWSSAPSYHEVLKSMPEESTENMNIILHRRPNKGDVAVLSKRSVYLLMYVFNEWKKGHK